jgi:hypothetical protein
MPWSLFCMFFGPNRYIQGADDEVAISRKTVGHGYEGLCVCVRAWLAVPLDGSSKPNLRLLNFSNSLDWLVNEMWSHIPLCFYISICN